MATEKRMITEFFLLAHLKNRGWIQLAGTTVAVAPRIRALDLVLSPLRAVTGILSVELQKATNGFTLNWACTRLWQPPPP